MLSTLLIGLGKVWVWAEDLGKVSADCLGRVWDSIWWVRGLGNVWWCGAGRWIDAVLTLLQTKILHMTHSQMFQKVEYGLPEKI